MDRADADGQFQKALDETKAMLDAHPEITAIMCGNDQIAVGAITALNLAERKDIIVYGIDGSPDIKKELVKKTVLWQEQWHSLRFTWVRMLRRLHWQF